MIFRQRCKDIYYQEWTQAIRNSQSLHMYYAFKSDIVQELYLIALSSQHLRRALTKFRCGSTNLKIISYRRSKDDDISVAMCDHCKSVPEDEYHVLMKCPLYAPERTHYIPSIYIMNPSKLKFVHLLNSNDHNIILRLAIFVHKIMSMRSAKI